MPVLPQLTRRNEGPIDQRLRRDVARTAARASRTRDAQRATATTSIFGDLGNDWLVGGTGHDTLWGGWGNDLLNADDDLSTGCIARRRTASARRPDTWLNDAPDTHPTLRGPRLRRRRPRRPDRQHRRRPPDRLGRRVQQLPRPVRAVRHRDRQPPGAAGAVRVPLRALEGAGRRPDARGRRRAASRAARNGEPNGELGLVTQKDHGLWQEQTGSPTDPQAGNIPGGKRDVLRTANFNDGTLDAASRPTAASWQVDRRRAAGLGGLARPGRGRGLLRRPDAAGLLRDPGVGLRAEADRRLEGERLRHLRLLLADRLQVRRASTSRSTRSSSATATRAAGSSTRRRRHRQRQVGHVYDLLVVVNGLVVTVLVERRRSAHAISSRPRCIDGVSRTASTWASSASARTTRAAPSTTSSSRTLPPQSTLREHRGLRRRRRRPLHRRRGRHLDRQRRPLHGHAVGERRRDERHGACRCARRATPRSTVDGDGQARRPAARAASSSTTTARATSSTSRSTSPAGAVVVGHRIKNQWVVDATFAASLAAGVDYKLALTLNGTAVTVSLNGVVARLLLLLRSGRRRRPRARSAGPARPRSTTCTSSIGTHVSNSPDSQPPTLTVPGRTSRARPTPARRPRSSATPRSAPRPRPTTSGVASSSAPASRPGNLFPIGVTTITLDRDRRLRQPDDQDADSSRSSTPRSRC